MAKNRDRWLGVWLWIGYNLSAIPLGIIAGWRLRKADLSQAPEGEK